MHTTNDSQTFIHVERATKTDHGYFVQGWVASELGEVVGISTPYSDLQVEFGDRPDVFDFYPTVINPKGFDLYLDDIKSDIILKLANDLVSIEIGNIHGRIIKASGFMPTTHKDIIVVDDFYADPDAVREYAMNNLEFQPSNYHKGQRATERFILDGTKEKLEEIIGRKIYNWNHGGYANGIFQFCTADQPIVYHIDTQMLAAMVYLTPDAPVETGTAMYKSKITGVRGFPGDTRNSELYEKTFKGISAEYNFYDSTQYEMVDTVGNVYNRLVIFNSSNIHAATKYFGDNIENSRFFHMFFFDVE